MNRDFNHKRINRANNIKLFNPETGSDVIPKAWYSTIRYKSGLIHEHAMRLLSWLIAFHQSQYIDDGQGHTIEKRKFTGDKQGRFITTYSQAAQNLSLTYSQSRDSFHRLKELNLISWELTEITVWGRLLNNCLAITLNYDEIERISLPVRQHRPSVPGNRGVCDEPQTLCATTQESEYLPESLQTEKEDEYNATAPLIEDNNETNNLNDQNNIKLNLLKQLGIADNGVIPELLEYSWVTPQYLKNWLHQLKTGSLDWANNPTAVIISNIRQKINASNEIIETEEEIISPHEDTPRNSQQAICHKWKMAQENLQLTLTKAMYSTIIANVECQQENNRFTLYAERSQLFGLERLENTIKRTLKMFVDYEEIELTFKEKLKKE